MWTFVVVQGVEPTNNHAERVQRRAVLWRRRSFGCHSADGCRFVERILTVVQTLRLQKRSVVQFLQEAIAAHRSGQLGSITTRPMYLPPRSPSMRIKLPPKPCQGCQSLLMLFGLFCEV